MLFLLLFVFHGAIMEAKMQDTKVSEMKTGMLAFIITPKYKKK